MNGDALLAAGFAEIEKCAPLLLAKRTKGFESADETDKTVPEKSALIQVVDQYTDVVWTEGEPPRGTVRGRVFDEKKCVVVEAEVTRLIPDFLDFG